MTDQIIKDATGRTIGFKPPHCWRAGGMNVYEVRVFRAAL
jgi:hypothetical protein